MTLAAETYEMAQRLEQVTSIGSTGLRTQINQTLILVHVFMPEYKFHKREIAYRLDVRRLVHTSHGNWRKARGRLILADVQAQRNRRSPFPCNDIGYHR